MGGFRTIFCTSLLNLQLFLKSDSNNPSNFLGSLQWRRGFLYAEGGMSGDEIVATEDFLYGLQGALYLLAGVRGHQRVAY